MFNEKQFKKGLAYVKKMHDGQFRAGKAPVWHHLLRVSGILRTIFEITEEGTRKEQFCIYLSALGHDVLEDTKAKKSDIKRIFGIRGLKLIDGMTNSWGDEEKTLYIQKICDSEEEVRLIKLADLIDNYLSVSYTVKLLGILWINSFFLPIVVPMRKEIIKTKFKKFKNTAGLLVKMLEVAARNLETELEESRIDNLSKK